MCVYLFVRLSAHFLLKVIEYIKSLLLLFICLFVIMLFFTKKVHKVDTIELNNEWLHPRWVASRGASPHRALSSLPTMIKKLDTIVNKIAQGKFNIFRHFTFLLRHCCHFKQKELP